MRENKLSPEEEKHIENQLKVLDLELTYDAQTHISEDAPPEIISQWLDNVKAYEEQYANAPKVPIHEFIGQPKLRPEQEVPDGELEAAIESLLSLMQEKSVLIDRPEHLKPRTYYRFLTEDLMPHLMTDHSAEGMVHFFNYHEFHHDGPEFIEAHVSDFLLDLMNLEKDFEGVWLAEECRGEVDLISRQEAILSCQLFRAKYRAIKPLGFRPETAEVHNGTMYLFFSVAWDGFPLNGEKTHHNGLGISQLDWIDGEWMVVGVQMPGFQF